jgi:hypothetical protein
VRTACEQARGGGSEDGLRRLSTAIVSALLARLGRRLMLVRLRTANASTQVTPVTIIVGLGRW